MEKLKSRKFWMAVVAGILLILTEGLGMDLPIETILAFAAVVASYIFGEAYIDAKKYDNGPRI